MSRNGHDSSVRLQVSGLRFLDSVGKSVTLRGLVAVLVAALVVGASGAAFHFAPAARLSSDRGPQPVTRKAVSTVSLPLFFEPNQGQTDPQVKFLARGSGYGLFLTADEAVLELQHSAPSPFGSGQAKNSHQPSAVSTPHSAPSVIRMRLDGANSAARVSGAEPLPGKSNYFIGNDPAKWHRGIPQFARVEYKAVYPGVNLVYYGNQGQLEYDFRVAPGAEPSQIALDFDGASAHLDSGDLVLATAQGDVRFHAPHIYQHSGQGNSNAEKAIVGSFRQLAENKIGFAIGAYDHSRELVIDPILTYSTYLGGTIGIESQVKVAVGANSNIYLAGATTSTNFPATSNALQPNIAGTQNIFIAEINPSLQPIQQLVYATYLGGSQADNLAGIAVDANLFIYVAGWTTSPNFPTTSNAFQGSATGTHGFLSKLNPGGNPQLLYSTYLAGNGVDTVTGLAIDNTAQNAYVTGATTSTNDQSNGFPANPNGYQITSNGSSQFFASKINTTGSGSLSMLYSTYFGGGNPAGATTIGGGIAVDASGNMYITGGTNLLGVTGGNGEKPFPLFNAQQSCLDEASKTVCSLTNPSKLDAFAAKINPNVAGSVPVYSTYLGGQGDDIGLGIAVDSSGNAYVTGSTQSTDWIPPTAITPFQTANGGGVDAFIAKIGNPGTNSTSYPLTYFTYLGATGTDIGQAIAVDSLQAAHVVGSTSSPDLVTVNGLQTYGLNGDAFVGLISTTASGVAVGDYLTYLGGNQLDQGTGIALDVNNSTYVSGTTLSPDFPISAVNPPYQGQLNGTQNAFVSKIGALSAIEVTVPKDSKGNFTSPSPNPVAAGTQVAFTFDLTNTGPDTATNVIFLATIPASGVGSQAAKVTSGGGTCGGVIGTTITCTIPTLAANAMAAVEVDLTPTIPIVKPQITVLGAASANGGAFGATVTQPNAIISDFAISATPTSVTIAAGQSTAFVVSLIPQPTYSGTISMTDSGLPTASTGTFTSASVVLSGTGQVTTTLNITTTARQTITGSLLRGRLFYATWLPIGGLSLLGLGVGAGFKRRRWLAGAVLGLIAGMILLQSACGSSSSKTTTTGTPAGTYSIVITGSNGSVSHNKTVTLIVQ